MKPKHIAIRIKQCLDLAEASNCPRRKFGALLLDPNRNVVLMDGYNGGPRGSQGSLCKGTWCERDGLSPENVTIEKRYRNSKVELQVLICGVCVWSEQLYSGLLSIEEKLRIGAEGEKARILEKYQPIPSGTRLERGCHHAEGNVICNAASSGVKTEGAWLIVTGEPCLMCAKSIHHAGISKVLCVKGGYKGGDDGPDYLRENGVQVEYVEGPRDPRDI